MAKPKPSDILFWFLAGLTMALLLVFVLVLAGAIPVESSDNAAATEENASTRKDAIAASPTTETATTATTSTRPSDTTTQRSPTASATQLTNVVITASRGDCWVLGRLGSDTGPVLDERILAQGESMRLRGPRVWVSVGASGNVDLTVNGKPRPLPSGTVEVLLSPTT